MYLTSKTPFELEIVFFIIQFLLLFLSCKSTKPNNAKTSIRKLYKGIPFFLPQTSLAAPTKYLYNVPNSP